MLCANHPSGSSLAFANPTEPIATVNQCVSITADAVTLLGHDLLAIRDSALFRQRFGSPGRQREIKMHPSGTRIAMEHPSQPSLVVVDVNGSSLSADTTERGLPRDGATPIVASFGRRYFIETARYVLDFTFDQRRDARGRKTGARRLAMLSFSWRP
jgi:hypothetical protein